MEGFTGCLMQRQDASSNVIAEWEAYEWLRTLPAT